MPTCQTRSLCMALPKTLESGRMLGAVWGLLQGGLSQHLEGSGSRSKDPSQWDISAQDLGCPITSAAGRAVSG